MIEWSWCTLYKKILGTTDRMELVIYSARQFGIKDMELKTVRVRNIVWMGGYTSWSEAYLVTLTDIYDLSFVFLVNAGP